MGTSSYLIAVGGNAARSRRIVSSFVTPAKARVQLSSPSEPSPEGRSWIPAFASMTVVSASSIHTSRPIGPSIRAYANAVALIETDLAPPALLAHLKTIERAYGRRPGRRWGARPLDLDIIGWSGGIWASPGLAVPHPAFRMRRFVLAPLVEIAPDWRNPVTHLTARQLLARLDRKRPRP